MYCLWLAHVLWFMVYGCFGFALIMYCEFDDLWLVLLCIVSLMIYGFACEFDGLMYCEFDVL